MKVIDLFCGAGGLSHGFRKAGFNIIDSYDNWQPAIETYSINFPHSVNLAELNEDITLPSADVIIGGPPCQGFSSAGLRKSGDARNNLISVFSQLVAKTLPKAFVFENVEGFLTGEEGKHIFELLKPLIRSGYRIHLRKINASNFGVPQHRKRVLAIGGLGWNPTFPVNTHSSLGAPGAELLNRHGLPFSPSVGAALQGLPPATLYQDGVETSPSDHSFSPFGKMDKERASLLSQGQRMCDLPGGLRHKSYDKRANRRVRDGIPTERRGGAPSGLRRLAENEPSKAITGGAFREFIHPLENRPLTIRECARLQTFPDEYSYCGTRTDKFQLIGNAVPPKLAYTIAKSLFDDIKQATDTYDHGTLLSFVPTASNGKSPILQRVTNKVDDLFMDNERNAQGELCL